MREASATNRPREQMSLWVNRVYQLDSTASDRTSRDFLQLHNVHPHLVDVLESHNINKLLPVQEQAIPLLLNDQVDRHSLTSSDIVITAPTGQGKTLCYLLPIVDNIVKSSDLSAIIIAPTRELAQQIFDFCVWFMDPNPCTYNLKNGALLKAYCCQGNASFLENHLYLLDEKPQIVIFTPGRFIEHYNHRNASHDKVLDFTRLRFIVIDEVDALLSQSYYNWTAAVVTISKECQDYDHSTYSHSFYRQRPQKLLVSATIPTKSAEIDLLQLNRPLLLKFGDAIFKVPDSLSQMFIRVNHKQRLFGLVSLLHNIVLESAKTEKVIVFCSMKERTHQVSRVLEIFFHLCGMDVKIMELSSLLSQKQRNEVIRQYQEDRTICLVCSDVGSRGINFSGTGHIVNYDFPKSLSNYIHRIGRTARANEKGASYVLLDKASEVRFNNFLLEIQLNHEQVQEFKLDDLLPQHRSDFDTLFKQAKEMLDKCLELENAGRIPHDASLPNNWQHLLSEKDVVAAEPEETMEPQTDGNSST